MQVKVYRFLLTNDIYIGEVLEDGKLHNAATFVQTSQGGGLIPLNPFGSNNPFKECAPITLTENFIELYNVNKNLINAYISEITQIQLSPINDLKSLKGGLHGK